MFSILKKITMKPYRYKLLSYFSMKKVRVSTLIGLAALISIAGSAFGAEIPTETELNAILCDRMQASIAENQIPAKNDAVITRLVERIDKTKLHKAGINLDVIIADVQTDLQGIPATEEVLEAEALCSIN